MYNPISKKITVSRDVVFEEEENWDWGRRNAEAALGDSSITLTWENDGENVAGEEEYPQEQVVDDHHEADEIAEDGSNNNNGAVEGEEAAEEARPIKVTRPPNYLLDYDCGHIMLLREEATTQFTDGYLLDDHVLQVLTALGDPTSSDEAVGHQARREAMKAKIDSIESNQTWEMSPLPKGAKTIGVKWVFKTKYDEDGEIDKFKAPLVAKGYAQRYEVDYDEVYTPVARWNTIQIIIATAASNSLTIYQLDVKSTFLHIELNEVVDIDQLQGFIKKGSKEKVYRLRKALYGLKQAPRAWFSKIDSYFIGERFEKCDFEHTMFVKTEQQGHFLIVSLYVDDLIVTGNCENLIVEFNESMKKRFDMTDLGKIRYFLGVEIM